MKITLRQIEAACRIMNSDELAGTPWGVLVERVGKDIAVIRVPRKPGIARMQIFLGGPREVTSFLVGLRKGVVLERSLWPKLEG